MKQNWTCSRCIQKFSRKWNLERHFKLVHGQHERLNNFETRSDHNLYGKSRYNYNQKNHSPPGAKDYLAELAEIIEMRNKMSNSSQTFERMNSLQSQVGALQKQLAQYQSQLNDIYYSYWLIPRDSIQGLSGYICPVCQNFSLKPIFNIGYDKTMQSRHCCNELPVKRNYFNFKFPSNYQNINDWATQILFDHISYKMPFSKYLYSKDLTKGFSSFSSALGVDTAREILGIPNRYYSYSLENNYDIDWIDRAVNSIEKKIPIKDNEARDFLKRVKSTYAIFEIPTGGIVKQVYIGFTGL